MTVSFKVLIVEDEKSLVDLLRGYLEREGFEVREALDVTSAVEEARGREPDVVILDWNTPRSRRDGSPA